MARRATKKDNRFLAKLVTWEGASCAFCLREVDDEVTYGKLYAIGDIQCHYFCCLLSCCLIQKGHDDEGLFGFMYTDICAELDRCTKHKCSYCNRNGANLGCSVSTCRKQFHLPCGRERNAVSLYYGTYKSFCQQHAPRQKIPEHIMVKARLRQKNVKEPYKMRVQTSTVNVEPNDGGSTEEMVCVICYESVDGFPTNQTFWPPCCAKDAWFHRRCLHRMALSAGMHYLKCPLCNDKENFYDAVVSQGYYVPDRDAAWELEQNAFAEIYERPVSCCADLCLCPDGREHDGENGKWDIKLCLLCGSEGAHAHCITDQSQPSTDDVISLDLSQSTIQDSSALNQSEKAMEDGSAVDQSQNDVEAPQDQSNASIRYVCKSCLPAAPEDLNALASSIEAIILQEQVESTTNARRLVMPSRMSLRRTKGRRALHLPSSSRSHNVVKTEHESSESANTHLSRQELNLKTPRKPIQSDTTYKEAGYKFLSPVKLLEQGFREKMVCTGVRDAVLDEDLIETLRRKFRKPRPLCEKKRIVNNILDGLFDNLMKDEPMQKEQLLKWCSPKKSYELFGDSTEQSDKCELKATENQENKNNSNLTNSPKKNTDVQADDKTTLANKDVRIEKKEIPERNTNVCRNSRSSDAKTVLNKADERDIEERLTRNRDHSRNKINFVSDTVIAEESNKTEREIEATPTRIKNDSENETNSVSDKVKNENGKSFKDTEFMAEDNQIDEPVKPKKSELKSSKRKHTSKKKKSHKKAKKSPIKHSKGSQNRKEASDSQKSSDGNEKVTKPKPFTIEEDIITPNGNFLRKLLTHKDLTYQLLTELTVGTSNETNPLKEKPTSRTDTTMNHRKTPDLIETPKNTETSELIETPRQKAMDTPDLMPQKQKSIETPHVGTPKCKTIDMQQDSSLEITGNDQAINIDVIKIEDSSCQDAYKKLNIEVPEKSKTCSFKFSPLDKETLEKINVGIDLENFKKEYLNEVDKEFQCNFRHKHLDNVSKVPKLRTALDFAIGAAFSKELSIGNDTPKGKKRKMSESGVKLLYDNNVAKKRKTSESDLKLVYNIDDNNESKNAKVVSEKSVDSKDKKRKGKKRKKSKEERKAKKIKRKRGSDEKNIEVTIDSTEKRSGKDKKVKKKIKTKFAIQNENIHVKIKWKKKQLSLNIESKKQAKKEKRENSSKLKQYVLQFSENSSREVLMKPEKEVCPLKRKYVKQDKNPDKLKQMFIQNFFKLKSPDT